MSHSGEPTSGAPPLPSTRTIALVALLTALAGYGRTLDGRFVGDDFSYAGRCLDYPLADWPGLFVRGWADGLSGPPMRELGPLHALTFMIDGRFWDTDPLGYRLTNLALHAAATGKDGIIPFR